MECNDQKVDALITEDCIVIVKEIVAQLVIGHNAMQETRKTLGYQKVCCCLVLQLLTHKCRRVGNHSCFDDMLPKAMTLY
jgi:hypothetical protein